MAAVPLFRDTNMAAMASRENTLLLVFCENEVLWLFPCASAHIPELIAFNPNGNFRLFSKYLFL